MLKLEMEKCKKIITFIVMIIIVPILFINCVILIDSAINPNEIPSFFCWKPFIVLSGSMETEISSGDIAVVKEIDSNKLKINDIIAFRQDEIVIVHRIANIIVEDGETKYITKGDNNENVDEKYVTQEQVEGIFQFRINRLGNLAVWIQTPIGMIVAISIPLLILIILQNKNNKEDRIYMNKQSKEQEEMKKEQEEMKKELEELRKQNELLKNKNN